MERWLLEIGSWGCLGRLAFEDFREREVSVWPYWVLAGLWGVRMMGESGEDFWEAVWGMRLSMVGVYVGVVWGYACWRGLAVRELIGSGDLWFMVLLTLGIPVGWFVGFTCGSLVVALGWWCVTRSRRGIPLVGIQACCYLLLRVGLWMA